MHMFDTGKLVDGHALHLIGEMERKKALQPGGDKMSEGKSAGIRVRFTFAIFINL